MDFRSLVKKILRYNSESDIERIQKAYKFSSELLKNVKRYSGEQEINHNLRVAHFLADIKSDDTTIIAGLLHNVLDRSQELDKKVEVLFGINILKIIQKTSKKNRIETANIKDEEKLRRLLVATVSTPRALLIKLCNKLDTLSTISYLDDENKSKKVAKEALKIYAPIAHQLGINIIKSQLEDLSFKILEPEKYKEIVASIKQTQHEREQFLYRVKRLILESLKNSSINTSIQLRTKHIYSIYKKIINRGHTLDSIKDILAIRIIVNEIQQCYHVLDIISKMGPFSEEDLKDYIAHPKSNGYQSIHTVIYFENQPIEIQIRTQEMHEIAESGIAAHVRYKGHKFSDNFEKELMLLRTLLDIENPNFDLDIISEQIIVRTPKGDLFELPRGATIIDLAYKIHTRIGHTAISGLINGVHSELKTKLKNNDLVEVITQKNKKPSKELLKIAKTKLAKEKIKNFLNKSNQAFSGTFREEDSLAYLIEIKNPKKLQLLFHKACQALPGDEIFAHNKPNSFVIHSKDCPSVKEKEQIDASWKLFVNETFILEIVAKDRVGLFADVLKITPQLGIYLKEASAKALEKNRAKCKLLIEFADIILLKKFIFYLRTLEGFESLTIKKEN